MRFFRFATVKIDFGVTKDEMVFLKKSMNEADLMLIPVAFNIKSVAIKQQVILWDTQSFVYTTLIPATFFQCPNNLNVNLGRDSLTAVLIGMTREYYMNNFILKHKIK